VSTPRSARRHPFPRHSWCKMALTSWTFEGQVRAGPGCSMLAKGTEGALRCLLVHVRHMMQRHLAGALLALFPMPRCLPPQVQGLGRAARGGS